MKFKFIFQPQFSKIVETQCGLNGVTMTDIANQYGVGCQSLNKLLYNEGFLTTDANGTYVPKNKKHATLYSHERNNDHKKYKTLDGSAVHYNNTPYYNKEGYREIVKILASFNILPLNVKLMQTTYETSVEDRIVSIRRPNWTNPMRGTTTGDTWTIFCFKKDKLHKNDIVGSWCCQPLTEEVDKLLDKKWKVEAKAEAKLYQSIYAALDKQFRKNVNIKSLTTEYSNYNKKLLKALI